MTDHPITPPPELVEQWCHEDGDEIKTSPRWYQIVATKAARWGSDQELEACCEILRGEFNYHHLAEPLRAARRPKPPSLKQRGLNSLAQLEAQGLCPELVSEVRRALEALPDV